MKRFSNIEESVWGDIRKRGNGSDVKQEDIPEQDKEHWWRNIGLNNVIKYPADQLKAYDIMYNLVIYKLFHTLHIKDADQIIIHFKGEPYWDLTIAHNTSYGNDTFSMYAHGNSSPWQIQFSKMNTNEKRSIRQRLEKKTFYIYKYVFGGGTQIEYHLREEDTYKGEKGILMKNDKDWNRF